jgi:hypothetical protein
MARVAAYARTSTPSPLIRMLRSRPLSRPGEALAPLRPPRPRMLTYAPARGQGRGRATGSLEVHGVPLHCAHTVHWHRGAHLTTMSWRARGTAPHLRRCRCTSRGPRRRLHLARRPRGGSCTCCCAKPRGATAETPALWLWHRWPAKHRGGTHFFTAPSRVRAMTVLVEGAPAPDPLEKLPVLELLFK